MATNPNIQKGTPGKILLGFSLLMLLAAAATVQDWGLRDEIEEFEFPTGLQDDSLFPSPPDGFPLDEILITFDGTPFYSVRRQSVERGDDIMLRVAVDDSGQWSLYQFGKEVLRGQIDEIPASDDRPVFLKTGNDSYLEVSPTLQSNEEHLAPPSSE